MNEAFNKPYNPTEHEDDIYDLWEKSGYFTPENLPDAENREPYTIVLPPPNVTGTLHMGHAAMLAVEDILIRHARMNGKRALWIPGTDSAAIATQAKVEKEIQKKEGKSRYDLGRDELLARIGVFVEESKSTILNQLRKMGSSLDWTRYAYTMDEPRYRAVMEAFIRMHEAGLIYRGNRIVNWDPKGQTTISDDEIVHEERDATLATFRYWKDFPIPVSTTRLETKVGDTAVAVHPDDERYAQYVGQTFEGEFAGKRLSIKVVSDASVEKEFGTGALGVTPAHSHADWEIADRHDLARPQVINEKARMTDEAGPLVAGLKVAEAREKVAAWLRENGLMEKEETIKQNVSTAERTGGIVEPLPKLQWFIDVNKEFERDGKMVTLKQLMHDAVASHEVQIFPDRFERVYHHWIDNLRDWCISRQIWFGHRIPVWYQGEELKVQIDSPGDGWTQDEDVLDTWFSSGLWTFSTLGWPDETPDLKTYHPTTVLETGYDILFFWVARMILMSTFLVGEVPFKHVYLHGLVRDAKGRKMSKSIGNIIDPLDMIVKYGADAARMSLVVGSAAGSDIKLAEDKVKGYKHFANKLWNITRFILMNLEGSTLEKPTTLPAPDEEILATLGALAAEVGDNIEKFQFHLASEKLYHYVWHELADKILEESKAVLNGDDADAKAARQYVLYECLTTSLKLLHPFMPFVTEAIWQKLPHKDADVLMVAKWPINP